MFVEPPQHVVGKASERVSTCSASDKIAKRAALWRAASCAWDLIPDVNERRLARPTRAWIREHDGAAGERRE